MTNFANKLCWVVDLGRMEYVAACGLQRRIVAARKAAAVPDVLLLCEHPHVITLGRNGKRANLLASGEMMDRMGVSFFETNRGGDITYHGPGQIVAYPILNLAEIRRDVAWYVRALEEAMIRVSANFGITAKRIPGWTGAWVDRPSADSENTVEEKLGAIGVHLSRWITSHGFAYNVATDLRFFDLIVPCGIAGRRATSLERLLGNAPETQNVLTALVTHMGELFSFEMRRVNINGLESALLAHEDRQLLVGA